MVRAITVYEVRTRSGLHVSNNKERTKKTKKKKHKYINIVVQERGVLIIFGAIRASHTPQTPINITRKRRESCLAERDKSAGLERAPRSPILAGPTGACRCSPDPGRDYQKAEKRPQRSVLPAHSVRGIHGRSFAAKPTFILSKNRIRGVVTLPNMFLNAIPHVGGVTT
ncbi:hypothetical protein NDU88_008153 [Pleurodeles waltl]|uniref:Uncharacterized protein n=1 Tax=Pleurodeles waltl TaxID=8319 RepID=A0AAV7QP37_PLEWA|nr:hypothetical protein NDU88_008153 [Pleurodeles waltl]